MSKKSESVRDHRDNDFFITKGMSQHSLGRHLSADMRGDALFIMADSRIVFHNRRLVELFGYESEELVAETFLDLIHPEDREALNPVLSKPVECDRVFRILRKNKDEIKCQACIVPIFWDKKNGVLVSLKDLTPQKELEEKIQQAQKMEALGTLVAGVAHEINNPLNLIMYNTPLLQKIWRDFLPVMETVSAAEPGKKYGGLTSDYLKENLHQLLSDIDMAANRIAKIVEDLKNFSKQSDVSEKQPMDINATVENALRLAKTFLKKSKISVSVDLNTGLPQLEGNPHSIEQVILNIILNAVQAISHDHGRIDISTRYDIKRGQILVSVADNGPGIDPAIGKRIFDPFVTSKQTQGGTGLGLSVSYNLVKAHNGDISYQHPETGGTIFTIHLPIKDIDEKFKILVADDDELIREIIVKILQQEDLYLLDEALNGIEACIKLGTYKPDLLILDIMMPEMDGVEVCRTIWRNDDFKDLKVLITTGHPEHAKVNELQQLGFTNVIGKPFNLKNFTSEVRKILTS